MKLLVKVRYVCPEVAVGVPVWANARLAVKLRAVGIAADGDVLLIVKR